MKLKSILILFLFISVGVFAQEFKTPVDYLSYIGNEQENIAKSTWKYTKAVAHSKSARRIDNTRKQLLKSIESATTKIKGVKEGYKGDVEFRNQTLDYLSFVEKNIKEEYDKIIDMQEVSEQSYDLMEAYIMTMELVNEKLDAEQEKVTLAQSQFALKYNITLTGEISELGKKMEKSNEVFKYRTVLYLMFFKTNITDSFLSKAIEKKDLVAIEQNKNAIIQYANEGLEKLKEIKPYSNDSSLITATKKALEFYKKQGENHIQTVTNFYMFNDKFESAKKSMESKKKSDITKEEVDNYNKMVKEVNNQINNYNKENTSNFNNKSVVVTNWNTTAEKFITKHFPNE